MSAIQRTMLVPVGLLVIGTVGCISVKAPREVYVGSDRPARVDSRRVPDTVSHEDCRDELVKAYQNIQWLEQELDRQRDEAAEYKHERDAARDKLDACEERLEKARQRD